MILLQNVGVDPNRLVSVVDLTGKISRKMNNEKALRAFIQDLVINGKTFSDLDSTTLLSVLPKDIRHVTYSSKKGINLAEMKARRSGIYNIQDLLANAVLIESQPNKKSDRKPNVLAYHRFYVPVRVGENVYTVRIVAEEQKGVITLNPTATNLYDVIIKKNHRTPRKLNNSPLPSGINSTRTVNNGSFSELSIYDMLKNVKDMDGNPYYQLGGVDTAQRTVEAVNQELNNIKGVTTETLNNRQTLITFGNGKSIIFDVQDNIFVTELEEKKAREEHGLAENEEITISGYYDNVETMGADGLMAISTQSENGVLDHELFHALWNLCLSDKEKQAMLKYYTPIAKKEGQSVFETMADASMEWSKAKREGKGGLFGKLFSKIKDLAHSLYTAVTGNETVRNVLNKVERGEVASRTGEKKLAVDNAKWNGFVDKWAENKASVKEGKLYPVMKTPLVLQMLGVDFNDLKVFGSFFKHSIRADHAGMTEKQLRDLPNKLAAPIMIFRGNKDNSYVFLIETTTEAGASVVVPVEVNKRIEDSSGIVLYADMVNSAFAKTKDDKITTPSYDWFARRIKNNDVLYINKEKSTAWTKTISNYSTLGAKSTSNALSEFMLTLPNNNVKTEVELKKATKDNSTLYSLSTERSSGKQFAIVKKAMEKIGKWNESEMQNAVQRKDIGITPLVRGIL